MANTAWQYLSRRYLECTGNNFLIGDRGAEEGKRCGGHSAVNEELHLKVEVILAAVILK